MIGGAYSFILSLSLLLTTRLPPLPLQICTEEYGSKEGFGKENRADQERILLK